MGKKNNPCKQRVVLNPYKNPNNQLSYCFTIHIYKPPQFLLPPWVLLTWRSWQDWSQKVLQMKDERLRPTCWQTSSTCSSPKWRRQYEEKTLRRIFSLRSTSKNTHASLDCNKNPSYQLEKQRLRPALFFWGSGFGRLSGTIFWICSFSEQDGLDIFPRMDAERSFLQVYI